MPLPRFAPEGCLPPGIHAATFREVHERYGIGSDAREKQIGLLQQVVEAAKLYPTIKRVLLWGSFVTAKAEPNDLDYSVIVSVDHRLTEIAKAHRRFLVPSEARQHYSVDTGYLLIRGYPLDFYIEQVDFICHTTKLLACGVVEISLRGEVSGE